MNCEFVGWKSECDLVVNLPAFAFFLRVAFSSFVSFVTVGTAGGFGTLAGFVLIVAKDNQHTHSIRYKIRHMPCHVTSPKELDLVITF